MRMTCLLLRCSTSGPVNSQSEPLTTRQCGRSTLHAFSVASKLPGADCGARTAPGFGLHSPSASPQVFKPILSPSRSGCWLFIPTYRHVIHTTTAARGAPYSHLYPFITNYPPPVPSIRQGCHYYKSDMKISIIQRIQEDANSKVTPLLKTHHLEILDEYYHKYLDTCLQLGEKTAEIIL